jgi:hypothetical protein
MVSLRRVRTSRGLHALAAGSRPARAVAAASAVLALTLSAGACAPAPDEPDAAVARDTAPPWAAPRDAVSYIEAAGLEALSFGHPVVETLKTRLEVAVDDEPVLVPAYIGIDRVRALEAVLHTHADDGVLWVESPTRGTEVTLGQLFDLWGVRLDARCLGDACGGKGPRLEVDGQVRQGDPRAVVLRDGEALRLSARR